MFIYGSLTAGTILETEPRYATKLDYDKRFEYLRPASFPMTRRYEVDSWDQDWKEVEGGENDSRAGRSRPVSSEHSGAPCAPISQISRISPPFFRVHSAPRQVVPGEESGQSLCRPLTGFPTFLTRHHRASVNV